MKNRGFTLIELILVVAVLGIVGVIVTISLTGTLQNTRQKECDDFVMEVEEAACVYVNLSNKDVMCTRSHCSPIPLSILVSEGLITSEIDACTNSEIDLDETVSITWSGEGEKTCTYNGVKEYGK